jgi:hypothetical protein
LRSKLHRGAGFIAGSVLFLCVAPNLRSHDPITTKLTWNREISRIVYKRCGACHHAGAKAMDLTTYEQARPWAKAIRDEVLARRMPPWGAVKGVGDFAGDPSLTQSEIDMFVAWVEGGAPEGERADLPTMLPSFRLAPQPHPRYSRSFTVSSELILNRVTEVIAVRPQSLPEGGSVDAWATRPDGSIERIIWLTDFRPAWIRTYVFREPVTLPAGTKLRVNGTAGSLIVYSR